MRTLLLAMVLLAPLAAAHLEPYSEAKPLVVGPYSALVEPYPAPAFENTAITLRSIFTRIATGAYVNDRDIQAFANVAFPDGTNASAPLQPDGTGYFVGYFVVRQSGDHTVTIGVQDAAGRYENATVLTVYPDVGVRLRPGDPDLQDPVVGRTYPVSVLVVDNVTLEPTDRITDLRARIEHWTDDHLTMLDQQEVTLEPAGLGRWAVDHTFAQKGMFHLRFASSSGGFNYDEVPLLHVYANEPLPGSTDPARETPLAPAAALVALALVALARRR